MKLLWALVFVLFVSGCDNCPDLDKDKIKEELSKELHVGDSRKQVEHVLIKSGMDVRYDEYQHRYATNISGNNCAFDKSVFVTIDIDKYGSVSKIDAIYLYTFL